VRACVRACACMRARARVRVRVCHIKKKNGYSDDAMLKMR